MSVVRKSSQLKADTRQRLVDVAEFLTQTRGYDGFSYADLETEVGIRKASIHYHFPAKADLGRAVTQRFRDNCQGAFQAIEESETSALAMLRRYVGLFAASLADGNRMCLCGILALNIATLPQPMLAELKGAIDDHEHWLAKIIARGQRSGELRREAPAANIAQGFFASLEGAMLLSRVQGDVKRFRLAANRLLKSLST